MNASAPLSSPRSAACRTRRWRRAPWSPNTDSVGQSERNCYRTQHHLSSLVTQRWPGVPSVLKKNMGWQWSWCLCTAHEAFITLWRCTSHCCAPRHNRPRSPSLHRFGHLLPQRSNSCMAIGIMAGNGTRSTVHEKDQRAEPLTPPRAWSPIPATTLCSAHPQWGAARSRDNCIWIYRVLIFQQRGFNLTCRSLVYIHITPETHNIGHLCIHNLGNRMHNFKMAKSVEKKKMLL